MQRVSIIQGELFVAATADILIGTLLGSCVAVCLHDAVARIGGMNHFLLGAPAMHEPVADDEMNRYGLHTMEMLINEMLKMGAARSRLRAHVYGGANIIPRLGPIGRNNAAFAQRFIRTEGIALGHTELGGRLARRVEFLPYLGKVRSWTVTDPDPPAQPRTAPSGGDLELF